MLIPLRYNLRYLITRWKSTAITAVTFSLVVATFVIVMSLSQGIERALNTTGNPKNLIVMRAGAQAESQSEVSLMQYNIVSTLEGLEKDRDGGPLVSPELLALVTKPRFNGKTSNLQLRGIHPNAFVLRPAVRLIAGRMLRPGLREAIVAESVAKRFRDFQLGGKQRLGRGEFTIVGIFDAQGTAYDSEVWTDCKELMQEFDRANYSSLLVRPENPEAARRIQDAVDKDRRLKLTAVNEEKYYADQTKTAAPVKAFALFLAVTMAIGACFAGMNTMYANVANRVREIGTLRILGFTPTAIMISFLIESVCLALAGGAIGCVLALPINGFATGTTNFVSFSEIVFYFTITPALMLKGMIFAAFMGLAGGLPPAWSASKQPLITALRQL